MPDTVLNALHQKLVRYEASGEADRVKQVKAKIAALEKGEKAAANLPMSLSPEPVTAPAVLGATVTKKADAPKSSAVKKATKGAKGARKKK